MTITCISHSKGDRLTFLENGKVDIKDKGLSAHIKDVSDI